MNLKFNTFIASDYKSPVQKIRVITEEWTKREIFCPNCGDQLTQLKNNNPVGDFICQTCEEIFELKSKRDSFGSKIVDGAYSKMIEKIIKNDLPNFFLLTYNPQNLFVTNFIIIPKYFFSFSMIEKRKALTNKATRTGWIGCNILLDEIPYSSKIYYVKNSSIINKDLVKDLWRKTVFINQNKDINFHGWTLDIINCIDKIGKSEFSLNDIYYYEEYPKLRHPDNKHIKEKIRQQLQYLRNKEFLEFKGNGNYKRR